MSADAGLRGRAARALLAVVRDGRSADAALAEAAAEAKDGDAAPRVRALLYGALRAWPRYAVLLDQLARRPARRRDLDVRALVAIGLFELDDARRPAHAVVSGIVDAARGMGLARAAGFVNALLRRYLREGPAVLEALAGESEVVRYAHPAWFIDALRTDWPAHWRGVLLANQAPPPLWLRVNADRRDPARYRDELAAGDAEVCVLPGMPAALRLTPPRAAHELPGFGAGEVSVQDAAAQLAGPLLGARPGMRVLDACAAPGGKTGQLLELAGGELDLVALDIDAERLARVADTLDRLGYRAQLATGDATRPDAWWDGTAFDRILVDAPCTATGVIRRHPDIRVLRRATDVAQMAARQAQMLDALWPLLAPGGRLLYCTCSVLAAENRDVIGAFLARRPDARALPIDDPHGLYAAQPGPGVQVLPGDADTDGFFYALMERSSATGADRT